MPRTEYGFRRTTCPCRACTLTCEHLPGQLAPADVERMAAFLEYTDVDAFARENLLAADGPRVVTSDRRVVNLPTLVPATKSNGHCVFLDNGRCSIHALSPYGCAFLDAHHSDVDLAARTKPLHDDILRDLESDGPYSRLWQSLRSANHTAPPARSRHYDLAKAMKRENLA